MSDFTSDERITDLQVKFSFLEEHITQQDREILKLRSQVERLASDIERLQESQEGSGFTIRPDEKPPHY